MFNKFKTVPTATRPPRGPLRQTFDEHLGRMESINARRRETSEMVGKLAADITAAENGAKDVVRCEAAINAKAVAAAVQGETPPDQSAAHAELAHLKLRLQVLEQRADVARQARTQLQAESDALLATYRPLQPQLSRLCHDAIVERMASYAPALAEAEAQYRAVLRRVFLHAVAADQLSVANQLGTFFDAQRFELHAPALPRHEIFDSLCRNRFQAHEDYMKLQTEAEQLIGRVLKGEDG